MRERHHSGLDGERPRRPWNRLSWYVLGQLLGPVALLALLMTCVILLTQSLKLLDLVINRGQSAPTFFYLTTADPAGASGDHRADRLFLRHAVHPVAAGRRQRTGGDVVRGLQPAPARDARLHRALFWR